jgi:site-specific DNA-methyltransferase (adenine-specific)
MIAWMYGSGFPKSHNLQDDRQGWGTALKPAMEPITMARKPFKGTVADNVQAYGTGAINIDGCRIGEEEIKTCAKERGRSFNSIAPISGFNGCEESTHIGRWPANVLHDGCDDVLRGMGEAARFFYTPKACKSDRDDGCEMMEARQYSHDGRTKPLENAYRRNESEARNFHPTVKPTDLMQYLCRLVTSPGGVVLDPFMGSGSTGKAAELEGFDFIGIDREAEYVQIATLRIEAARRRYQPCLIFD